MITISALWDTWHEVAWLNDSLTYIQSSRFFLKKDSKWVALLLTVRSTHPQHEEPVFAINWSVTEKMCRTKPAISEHITKELINVYCFQ